MVMWLSDDERRIPLQYLVEVKTGTIKLKLNASNLENYQTPVNCINRKPVSVMTSIEGSWRFSQSMRKQSDCEWTQNFQTQPCRK